MRSGSILGEVKESDLVRFVRREAEEATELRAEALGALADYLRALPRPQAKRGDVTYYGERRLRDRRVLGEFPELQALVSGYGHSGPGGEQSLVDAATMLINRSKNPLRELQEQPRWRFFSPWWFEILYGLWRHSRKPVRCPNCATLIPRKRWVCPSCGQIVPDNAR